VKEKQTSSKYVYHSLNCKPIAFLAEVLFFVISVAYHLPQEENKTVLLLFLITCSGLFTVLYISLPRHLI
jgi:hypothetical protein